MTPKIAPTFFAPKPQMHNKPYDIHYNSDLTLSHIDAHNHNYYEFYYFISGNVKYTIEESTYNLHPGDLLLIRPKQNHSASIGAADAAYERYILWLSEDYIKSLSSEFTNLLLPFEKISCNQCVLRLSPELRPVVSNLLQMILIQSKSKEYGCDLLTNAYITELLIMISRVKLYHNPSYSVKDFDNNDIISNTLNYITENIHQNITIKDITDHLFISRSLLSKEFTSYMGISIHQYIIKKKLYLAQQDLLHGITISNVVSSYNFGTYSTFFRAYKKEFGVSPSVYIKGQNISNHIP